MDGARRPAAASEVPESLQVGAKLRGWRKSAQLSLGNAATRSGLSVGYISQVERGLANPSLETLKRLADICGRTMGELFVDEATDDSYQSRFAVTRSGQRKRITYPGSGIMNELLTPDLQRSFEAIWVQAEPGATSGGHPHSHPGEECGLIISGTMQIWVGDEKITLEAGDAVYLESPVSHRWQAAGDDPMVAVWMITPPTF